MLAMSLPLIPPPASSLLPPLHSPPLEAQANNAQAYQQQRRPKQHVSYNRSSLANLSLDERAISQRKLAIAMYGYSWLKPAGCTKTMLGRREEEIEREEVERQLQEVEQQERNVMEAEEQERLEMLRRQGEEGEVVGEGERDLDEEVPDMDAEEEGEDEEIEEDEEDMDGDLDDGVPDAEAGESSWVYDTNRDPDTESEEDQDGDVYGNTRQSNDMINQQHLDRMRNSSGAYLGMDEAADTEAMINAMLDEDELGEIDHHHDLDDNIPDMDMDIDMDAETSERDLDDSIPNLDEEDEWQHTDTELEESEMDISILPNPTTRPLSSSKPIPRQRSSNIGPGTTHEEMRRTSGNIMMPPPPHLPAPRNHHSPHTIGGPPVQRNTTTPNYQTPVNMDSDTSNFSNLLSSTDQSYPAFQTGGNIQNTTSTTADIDSLDPNRRRNLFNTSGSGPGGGARRNLFGGFVGRNITPPVLSVDDVSDSSIITNTNTDVQNQNQNIRTRVPSGPASSNSSGGGLFTPGPRVNAEDGETRSTTRSGRVLHMDGRTTTGTGRRRGRGMDG